MPDLMNYSVTRLANASVSIPRWSIQGQIVDQDKGGHGVIADITAANVIFPNVLGNLTVAQQDSWVNDVVQQLIFKRFGL
jgi:hypothetical protein